MDTSFNLQQISNKNITNNSNIQTFYPDISRLLNSQRFHLDEINKILKSDPSNKNLLDRHFSFLSKIEEQQNHYIMQASPNSFNPSLHTAKNVQALTTPNLEYNNMNNKQKIIPPTTESLLPPHIQPIISPNLKELFQSNDVLIQQKKHQKSTQPQQTSNAPNKLKGKFKPKTPPQFTFSKNLVQLMENNEDNTIHSTLKRRGELYPMHQVNNSKKIKTSDDGKEKTSIGNNNIIFGELKEHFENFLLKSSNKESGKPFFTSPCKRFVLFNCYMYPFPKQLSSGRPPKSPIVIVDLKYEENEKLEIKIRVEESNFNISSDTTWKMTEPGIYEVYPSVKIDNNHEKNFHIVFQVNRIKMISCQLSKVCENPNQDCLPCSSIEVYELVTCFKIPSIEFVNNTSNLSNPVRPELKQIKCDSDKVYFWCICANEFKKGKKKGKKEGYPLSVVFKPMSYTAGCDVTVDQNQIDFLSQNVISFYAPLGGKKGLVIGLKYSVEFKANKKETNAPITIEIKQIK
ncbi:expressed protein [Dictyostelium purpureum]|uniref:Expressed protein n=1 Tax=Dictyostelium purpureum TaxID=5786 RepID=F0ZVY4_DICPU|nr:uncharacterized protein DICPUDRAFT_99073 [Dictyostelium purpureum]EGC31910.1 expressed protein [Dictyostelium purpureum]|eukprot:XP_003291580.1 expressed protein [Dictyostelium purpureum]